MGEGGEKLKIKDLQASSLMSKLEEIFKIFRENQDYSEDGYRQVISFLRSKRNEIYPLLYGENDTSEAKTKMLEVLRSIYEFINPFRKEILMLVANIEEINLPAYKTEIKNKQENTKGKSWFFELQEKIQGFNEKIGGIMGRSEIKRAFEQNSSEPKSA